MSDVISEHGGRARKLFLPPAPVPLVCALGVLGLGLGLFAPANNALLMRAVPKDPPGTGGRAPSAAERA
ncbi:hypothetical protein ACE1OC_08555 [Streptomyces sp. DSM 116496]|uniref:hypothetical protein n=1 Tax=Streptomyces stoeckheimensis TaxID=3344656 RepID=UPI0038B2E337